MGIGAHRVSFAVLTLAGCGLQVTGVAMEADAGPSAVVGSGPPSPGASSDDATARTPAPVADAAVDAPIAPPSTLTLAWDAEPATVDLDAEGKVGWIHWGRGDSASINRKSTAPNALPSFALTTRTGTPTLLRYSDHAASFRWVGGTPAASESGTKTGVFCNGDGATFTFRVPIDTAAHRVVLHTNVFKGRGRFGARLESGAAPGVTRDVDAGNGDAFGRTQIDVKASAATVLVVTFELVSPGNNDRNIAIAAATLE